MLLSFEYKTISIIPRLQVPLHNIHSFLYCCSTCILCMCAYVHNPAVHLCHNINILRLADFMPWHGTSFITCSPAGLFRMRMHSLCIIHALIFSGGVVFCMAISACMRRRGRVSRDSCFFQNSCFSLGPFSGLRMSFGNRTNLL